MDTKYKLAALLIGGSLSSLVIAQANDAGKISENYSPYFARENQTIFVSGPSSRWYSRLLEALPVVGDEVAMRSYNADPSKKIDLVVFVNATSVRPEKIEGAWFLIERLRGHSVSTKIVGECDMFCARLFVAGKRREFGQDLKGEPARLKIQTPVDFETKQIERKFPNTQISLYERILPEFANKYRELLVRGFTKPADITGGVFIGPNDVIYCETSRSENCEKYPDLNAFKMGLSTSGERTPVTLPDRFPAPVRTGHAAVDDLSKVPLRGKSTVDGYIGFLKYGHDNKAFAISENDANGVWMGASGMKDGEDAAGRALRRCEEISKAKCRLYASGNDVVW